MTWLVRHLARILPDCEFILLTSDQGHDECAFLERTNVRRLSVTHRKRPQSNGLARLSRLELRFLHKLASILPPSTIAGLHSMLRPMRRRRRARGLLNEIGADLLFCPLIITSLYDPCVPMVAVIRDLNYLSNPRFFAPEAYRWREISFRRACRLADRVICISDYTRQKVLAHGDLDPDRVITIRHRLFERLRPQSSQPQAQTLKRLGLSENRYLFFPALQFWPHKNHPLLFNAFKLYRDRHAGSDLTLVCTGAPDERLDGLRGEVARMGLTGWVVLPGYLSDDDVAALFQSSQAVIFPSLYEGFGMPLLEAMAFGKPVLCSNVTSLPEVAGDAAVYFDPWNPEEIADAIERIMTDPGLVADLVERGHQRIAALGTPEQMARDYLRVFREAMTARRRIEERVHGVHLDGWMEERVVITYEPDDEHRHLEMVLHVPPGTPREYVSLTVYTNGQAASQAHVVRRGESVTVRQDLSAHGGVVECRIEPTFRPKDYGLNDDERDLGCLCTECRIVSGSRIRDLLEDRV